MWTVILGKPVRRRIERIPNPDKERIKKAIKDLETKHKQMDIKPLVGRNLHRLRVGNWRLLMVMNEEEKVILITTLDSRGDVYKK